jgi:hypothetical protein
VHRLDTSNAQPPSVGGADQVSSQVRSKPGTGLRRTAAESDDPGGLCCRGLWSSVRGASERLLSGEDTEGN